MHSSILTCRPQPVLSENDDAVSEIWLTQRIESVAMFWLFRYLCLVSRQISDAHKELHWLAVNALYGK